MKAKTKDTNMRTLKRTIVSTHIFQNQDCKHTSSYDFVIQPYIVIATFIFIKDFDLAK